jgi:hypothetical protein
MKTAIMQPYLFPYIGYYQLMHAVDNFVFYDTANYIKGGWINRNRILSNDGWQYWGLKVHGSSNLKIQDIVLAGNPWKMKVKLLKTLDQGYSKAPHRDAVLELVTEVLTEESSLRDIATRSCISVLQYIGLYTPVCMYSSRFHFRDGARRNDKIIDMCEGLDTTTYINAIGGKSLYTKSDFPFDLRFLRTGNIVYDQHREFIPNLSIIDVLMFNSPERVSEFLTNYTLEQ